MGDYYDLHISDGKTETQYVTEMRSGHRQSGSGVYTLIHCDVLPVLAESEKKISGKRQRWKRKGGKLIKHAKTESYIKNRAERYQQRETYTHPTELMES